jgi:hypothetical protein
MTTTTELRASELFSEITTVLDDVRSAEGIPEATKNTCDHSLNSIHESIHGLSLWLRELLEWAPLQPATRANAVRLAGVLTGIDAEFHGGVES